MPFSSTLFPKFPFNTSKSSPANGLTFSSESQSQSLPHSLRNNQQPRPVCTWSAHAHRPGLSPSPFPRYCHALTATATATSELFLFGGYVHGSASNDLYVFSTRDFSTTLLQTSGKAPSPRVALGAVLANTNFLIWGGTTNFSDQNQCQDNSLYLLDLVSHEWTTIAVNGPSPSGRCYHTATLVGSKLFIIGGKIGRTTLNDIWAFDLNTLKSQPFWESYEPTTGNEMPLPRASHTSVTTEDRIIIFGGSDSRRDYNDTWSFDISTRTWTELHCTGPIPSSRSGHAAVLIDDVMYVFGGFTMDKTYLDDLIALRLSTLRWYKFHNEGPIPYRRSCHTMASDGTRVFLLGGWPKGAQADEISLIHVLDTKHIKYPETDTNAVGPNEKAIQVVRKSYAGPPTQDQPQHSSSSAHCAFPLRKVTTAVLGCPPSLQVYDKRNSGPNGRPLQPTGVNRKPRHVSEGDAISLNEKATRVARKSWAGPPTQDQPQHSSSSSLEDHTKKPYAGPPTLEQPQHSTSSAHGAFPLRKVTPVVLGCPPSPQVTDKRNPGPNGRPLQPTSANNKPRHVPEGDVSEGSKGYHAGFAAPHSSEGDVAKSDLERRLSVSLAAQTERDQRIAQLTDELALRSALLEQAEASAAEAARRSGLELREHADRLLMQSLRAKGDVELRDMQAKPLSRDQQCEKELAYVRVKLEAKESELEAVRLRLAEAEEGWIKSKGEADALRAQTAASRDDDQVIRRLIERVRDIEAKMASMQWNEKSIEAMECRNEG